MTNFINIAHRCRRPELMDQPELDLGEHVRALRGLRRINVLSRTGSVLWPAISRLARQKRDSDAPLRVLDIAAGGGDTPIALARWAARAGL
jgi:hypothetical protein